MFDKLYKSYWDYSNAQVPTVDESLFMYLVSILGTYSFLLEKHLGKTLWGWHGCIETFIQ